METFCTIITVDYLPYAKTLYSSLRLEEASTQFHTLIIDSNEKIAGWEKNNFHSHCLSDLLDSPVAKAVYKKYAATNPDNFRWALKPLYITYLLENNFDKVIFLDPDLYFIGPYDFLFNELDLASVLLTPHWNNINALEFADGLLSIMTNGLYNAGFVGACTKGLPAMKWWAETCHFKMERKKELGIYDDQKYLDVLPVEFSGVKVLQHRGCNLASWNLDTNEREIIDGKLMIKKTYEPIFIHFAPGTIENILNGNDILLRPYLEEYRQALIAAGAKPSIAAKFNDSALYAIKRKLLLRTRFKRFLFKLAEKL